MTRLKIQRESIKYLSEYSTIPMSFEVKSILQISLINNGLSGLSLEEIPVKPWIKKYDEIPEDRVFGWSRQWDISNWDIFSASLEGQLIGGFVIAHDTPGVLKLEDRKDITVLWDIRINPNFRGQGFGSILFNKAVECTREKRCKTMKIETQNTNVKACRFYEKNGCILGSINSYAYHELPNEAELVWYKFIN